MHIFYFVGGRAKWSFLRMGDSFPTSTKNQFLIPKLIWASQGTIPILNQISNSILRNKYYQ